jgi:tRNA nucleotidyltransferase (CCA-adding enzyme)
MEPIQESAVIHACKILRQAGYEAWIVGGAVRDMLLGRVVHDWDLTTNAKPDEIIRRGLFPRVIETGIKHGTVTALLEDFSIEITTYRRDGGYSDGRHPDSIEFSTSLEEDLSRRDFTINAIAYDPLENKTVDPFGGIHDLSLRLIQTVGDPQKGFLRTDSAPSGLQDFRRLLGSRFLNQHWMQFLSV